MSNDRTSDILYRELPLPVFIWRHEGEQFFLDSCNEAASRELDGSLPELTGQPLSRIYPGGSEVVLEVKRCFHYRNATKKEIEYRTLIKPEIRIVRLTCMFDKPDRVISVTEDLTDLREAEKALELAARTDELTGVSNRKIFRYAIEAEHSRTRRYGRPYSVILADIDHYKKLNDEYGQDFGDQVLVRVADLLKESLRDHDTVARWGGEEFIMLLPETERDEARTVAEKLRKAVESADMHVTVSVGVAVNDGMQDPERTLIAADRNLKRAKDLGRNRVEADARADGEADA